MSISEKSKLLVIDPHSGRLVEKNIFKMKNPNLFGMKVLNPRILL